MQLPVDNIASTKAAGQKPRGLFRAFARNSSGANAVEFGLVVFPFLATLLVIFEMSLDVFMTEALDNATRKAARSIMTGATQTAGTTGAQFKTNVLCPALPAFMSCSNVVVNVTAFNGGGTPSNYYNYVNPAKTWLVVPSVLDAAHTVFCPGNSGQYVLVQAFYGAPFLSAYMPQAVQTQLNGVTSRVLSSAATFKNEPFVGVVSPGGAGC